MWQENLEVASTRAWFLCSPVYLVGQGLKPDWPRVPYPLASASWVLG